MPMRRLALLAFVAAAPLLCPKPVMAAPVAAPLGFTLACNCSDAAGHAYAAAIRELLRKDSSYTEANAQPAEVAANTASDPADPVHIQVTSVPVVSADSVPRIALTVRYTHGDRSLEQRIQTCAHGPLSLAVALLVHDFKQMEADAADPLTPAEADSTIVTASLRK